LKLVEDKNKKTLCIRDNKEIVMDKIIVVIFETESNAYEGCKVLKELDVEGAITLYAIAVIAKDTQGKVSIKQAVDEGPLGTAVGLVTGSLIGLLGGPAGIAFGASVGTLGGTYMDRP